MTEWQSFRPRGTWLLVKADPRVKKTRGGIHLPDQLTKIERVMEGTGRVLRIGPKAVEKSGMGLAEGDRVVFRGFLKDVFHEFATEEDGQTIFILRVEDVLAKVDDNTSMGAYLGDP